MGEIRDFFIKTLDESEGGIKQKMAQLSAMLKEKDVEVWHRLEQQNLYPQYYSFRWLTLILSQEFPLPDVVRLWDSIFSDENRFEFLVRICCAMIMYVFPSTQLFFIKYLHLFHSKTTRQIESCRCSVIFSLQNSHIYCV